MLTIILTSVLILNTSLAWADSKPLNFADWDSWPIVGKADFTWLMFDIYSSQLKSPNGTFDTTRPYYQQPLALVITYRKAISSEQFTDATVKQWQKLSIDPKFIERWQVELEKLFPSVTPGDRLVFLADDNASMLLFAEKQTQQWRSIASFDDEFKHYFLAIWLDEKSQYPELRKQLIGAAHDE